MLLIESRAVFKRCRFHRLKAHLLLSGLRYRAAALDDRALFLRTETYREALDHVPGRIGVCGPSSRVAEQFVRALPSITFLHAREFSTSRTAFEKWARSRRQLNLSSFYRDARRRLGLLMDGDRPAGGRWNFDTEPATTAKKRHTAGCRNTLVARRGRDRRPGPRRSESLGRIRGCRLSVVTVRVSSR